MNNKQAAQGAGASKQVDELATISLEALFQRLGTTKAGLSEEEAEKRLDHTRGRRKGWRWWWRRQRRGLRNGDRRIAVRARSCYADLGACGGDVLTAAWTCEPQLHKRQIFSCVRPTYYNSDSGLFVFCASNPFSLSGARPCFNCTKERECRSFR